MMKRTPILTFVLILVFGLLILQVGPWWGLPLVSLFIGLTLRPSYPFALVFAAFLAGALIYGIGAFWFSVTGGDLPTQVAALFELGSGTTLGVVVAIVGGLNAAFAAGVGAYIRRLLQGEKPGEVFLTEP